MLYRIRQLILLRLILIDGPKFYGPGGPSVDGRPANIVSLNWHKSFLFDYVNAPQRHRIQLLDGTVVKRSDIDVILFIQ